jgi:hypothetical protein
MPNMQGVGGYQQPTPTAANLPRPDSGLRPGDRSWKQLLQKLRESVATGNSQMVWDAFTRYVPVANESTRQRIAGKLSEARKIAEGHDSATRSNIEARNKVQQGTVAASKRPQGDPAGRVYTAVLRNESDSLRHQREQATNQALASTLYAAAGNARGTSIEAALRSARNK